MKNIEVACAALNQSSPAAPLLDWGHDLALLCLGGAEHLDAFRNRLGIV